MPNPSNAVPSIGFSNAILKKDSINKLQGHETKREENLHGISLAAVGGWNSYLGPYVGGAVSYDSYSNYSHQYSYGQSPGFTVYKKEEQFNLGLRYELLHGIDNGDYAHRAILHNPLRFSRVQLDVGLFAEFGHGSEFFGGGGLSVGGKLLIVKPKQEGTAPFITLEVDATGGLTSHKKGLWTYGAQSLLVAGIKF